MYDPAVQTALLRALARWKRLPEEDLFGMLSPVDRLRFRMDALRDLEADGLVQRAVIGDEAVITITERGLQQVGAT